MNLGICIAKKLPTLVGFGFKYFLKLLSFKVSLKNYIKRAVGFNVNSFKVFKRYDSSTPSYKMEVLK